MLNECDILLFKEKYEEYDLLYVMVEGNEFIFRTLNREEYKEIINIIVNDLEFEDAICQCSLVYPYEYDFSYSYLPGLSSNVAPMIVQLSKFNNINSILETYYEEKESLKNFNEQCVILVKAAFPEYSYEDINKWTWKKLMQYTARAENIMNLRGQKIELINNYDSLKEEVNEKAKDLTDIDIGNALRNQGVDPMDYFSYEFKNSLDIIDYPIIGTLNWKDEDMMYAIRKQMENADEKRKTWQQKYSTKI